MMIMMISNEDVLNCGYISKSSQSLGLIYLCFNPVTKVPLFSYFWVRFLLSPKVSLPTRGTGEQGRVKCSELSTQIVALVSAMCVQSMLWL